MHIAVVGAGIAGLACARRLADRGVPVTVFERGDAPGGRVATMKTEIGGFDHGAQYFTTRDPAFSAAAANWQAAGITQPWSVAVHRVEGTGAGPRVASGANTVRHVGVPGMSAIATRMATGLDVRYGASIVGIDPVTEMRGARPRWSLLRRQPGAPIGVAVTEGLFDGVVVAIPAEEAGALLAVAPQLGRELARVRIEPCWALMLGFTEPIASDPSPIGDAAFIGAGRLAWIAREPSKPGRRLGERWTAHAQSAWSVEHFDDDPEDAKAKLLRAFHEATGTLEQPVYATAYRWRHALARSSLSCGHLFDAALNIGACGDWCRGHRLEDAWLSGTGLGDAMGTGR